eukprot:scaffold437442_cov41-Prasinocladus_malaysianus.AAC.1
MVIMMSGFPDDHGSFSDVVPKLESSHSLVTLCMPDYDTKALQQYWGYGFQQITDMMAEAIAKVSMIPMTAC